MMKLEKDKWKRMKLGEVCEIYNGSTPLRGKDEYWTNGTIPWFTIDDIREQGREITYTRQKITKLAYQSTSVKLIPAESVLLCCTASVGEYAITKIPLTTNQQFNGLTIKDRRNLNPYFLFHYSATLKNELMNLSGKTTIDFIPIYRIKEIKIPLPPLEEQQRFVELFQSVDQSIVHMQEQEENLKALQKTLSSGLANKKPIFGNLLSEKNCTPYSFGDISDCIEQHDKTPLENGLTRFIGLENIESENFTLQGFGNLGDGTTFTKRFSKGDVLFGKRRAYLKKVAIADLDGICSSDILVFRAKAKTMLPELLPYYASSDAFMNHAVSTSAGSLSPRTKWRDLAGFKLSIPDLKIQEKIVSVFHQLSESLTLIKNQTQTLKKLKQKLLNEILGE